MTAVLVALLICNMAVVVYVLRSRPVIHLVEEAEPTVEAEIDDELAEQMWLMSGELPISDLPYGVDGNG